MDLKTQKRLAAKILKIGKNRVWFDPDRLQEIKEAITKADLKALVRTLAIQAKPKKGISRFRTRKLLLQKRKGRRKGKGTRKGSRTARLPAKRSWINKIRVQRKFLKLLKSKKFINSKIYSKLYLMAKGNYFRSKRHIKLYLEEAQLIQHEKKNSSEKEKKDTGKNKL